MPYTVPDWYNGEAASRICHVNEVHAGGKQVLIRSGAHVDGKRLATSLPHSYAVCMFGDNILRPHTSYMTNPGSPQHTQTTSTNMYRDTHLRKHREETREPWDSLDAGTIDGLEVGQGAVRARLDADEAADGVRAPVHSRVDVVVAQPSEEGRRQRDGLTGRRGTWSMTRFMSLHSN